MIFTKLKKIITSVILILSCSIYVLFIFAGFQGMYGNTWSSSNYVERLAIGILFPLLGPGTIPFIITTRKLIPILDAGSQYQVVIREPHRAIFIFFVLIYHIQIFAIGGHNMYYPYFIFQVLEVLFLFPAYFKKSPNTCYGLVFTPTIYILAMTLLHEHN